MTQEDMCTSAGTSWLSVSQTVVQIQPVLESPDLEPSYAPVGINRSSF